MPTYDYRCTKCEHRFESFLVIKKRHAPTKKPCPACGEKKVELLIGSPAICDPIKIGTKTPDKGFRETLDRVREKCPGHSIPDRW